MARFREHHLVLCLLVSAALLRLAPHPENIAAIGALATFSGAYLRRRLWVIPLAALMVGDLVNGIYTGPAVALAYLTGYLLATWLGRLLLHDNDGNRRIGIAIAAGAATCWCLGTFGHWLAQSSQTVAGLLQSFPAAAPQLAGHLAGDTIYALLLFGTFKLTRELPFVYASPIR